MISATPYCSVRYLETNELQSGGRLSSNDHYCSSFIYLSWAYGDESKEETLPTLGDCSVGIHAYALVPAHVEETCRNLNMIRSTTTPKAFHVYHMENTETV